MYEELVRQLRACADNNVPCETADCGYKPFKNQDCIEQLELRAADAIEELQHSVEIMGDANAKLRDQGPEWIPVTDRLPEKEGEVLAYYGFNRGDGDLGMMFMRVLDYYATDPKPHFQHESMGVTVTHWQPLPEPPKEDAK